MKTDIPKRYIDWATSNGFQVIDINIPKMVSVQDVGRIILYVLDTY